MVTKKLILCNAIGKRSNYIYIVGKVWHKYETGKGLSGIQYSANTDKIYYLEGPE